ncbi:MAG: GC-type dockerin domain-anchored protein [Phycisphaerales bacterium]
MKTAAIMILAATAAAIAGPDTVRLTHSVDPITIELGAGIACADSDPLQTSLSNSFWRAFKPTDFGVTNDFSVLQFEFGVETLELPTLDAIEITVNFYETFSGTAPAVGLPLIGTTSAELSERSLELVTIDASASVTAGAALVVEISVPSLRDLAGGTLGDRFIPGGNFAGQTAPWYVSSIDCGILDPTDVADFGFPDSNQVVTVIGEQSGACCCVDIDQDGQLTIFDFLAFQSAFDAGDLLADFDGDGELTILDFLAFQTQFDAGCP